MHHAVGKVQNKWSGSFPNSEFTQISKWQYHACVALSWSSYGALHKVREKVTCKKNREGNKIWTELAFYKWKKRERGSVFTFWNYKFYATLDPTTGIPPLEFRLYKLLQINILKKTHLKMAQVFCAIMGTEDFKVKHYSVFSWVYLQF